MTSERAEEAIVALRAKLLSWYEANRRDLPWRRTRDPYAVWVSEAMLQQTRVEVVGAFFRRFLERLPTIAHLASADEDVVLGLWSGLGYYGRARALRHAAQRIVSEHAGAFPRARRDALALPGVGPYTAGAVLSIAYGLPEPAVDGNVARVFSRLSGIAAPLGTRASNEALWSLAGRLVPDPDGPGGLDPGAWNQALMELGALLCVAKSPSCTECPLRDDCVAHQTGQSAELPRRRPSRAPVDVLVEVACVPRNDEVLLVRRERHGRMAGMWELPTREVVEREPKLWPAAFPAGVAISVQEEIGEVRHAITHHRIRACVHRAGLDEASSPPPSDRWRWTAREEWRDLALTGLARKVLRVLSRS